MLKSGKRKAKGKRLGKSFSRIVNAFYHQRVADWIPPRVGGFCVAVGVTSVQG